MNMLFWLYLMEEEKNERIIPADLTLCGESKFDKWLDKHPVIEAIYPYVVGIVLGLLPYGLNALLMYCIEYWR